MAWTTPCSLVGPLRLRCCRCRHHGSARLQWWCRSPLRPRDSRARSVDQWCPALVGSQSRPFRELSAVAIASPIATARPTASRPPGSAQPKDSPLLPAQLAHRATTELVFASINSDPIRKSNFNRRYWQPAVQAIGLPHRVFHDLRHTSVALAIESDAHPKSVQSRLGHASITTTLNVYGHLFESLDADIADRLDQSMGTTFGIAN